MNCSFTGSESVVVLTGAGISRESGLATFRDADRIWAKVNIDDVATPGAFRRNPAAGAHTLELNLEQSFGAFDATLPRG